MRLKNSDKKARILEVASHLFGEHGYRGVSTRMITEKAKISHGSLHYHFGGKDNIYYEIIKLAYASDEALTYKKLLEMEPYVIKTDAGKSYAIHRVVQDYFRRHVFFNEPWKRHTILKEVLDPSPVYTRLYKEILGVEVSLMEEFFYLLKPGANSTEAFVWSHFPDTQGLYYILSWTLLQTTFDREALDDISLRVVNVTSKMMIEMLDLPVPEMLR